MRRVLEYWERRQQLADRCAREGEPYVPQDAHQQFLIEAWLFLGKNFPPSITVCGGGGALRRPRIKHDTLESLRGHTAPAHGPRVVVLSPSSLPCLYSKTAALTRPLVVFHE